RNTDNQGDTDRPKSVVNTPNSATNPSSIRPAGSRIGRVASNTAMVSAPTPGAARKKPRPQGPRCRMSREYTGNSDPAPPGDTDRPKSVGNTPNNATNPSSIRPA